MGVGSRGHQAPRTDRSEVRSAATEAHGDGLLLVPGMSLLSFLVLTYAYSWSIWFIAGLVGGHPALVWVGAWGPSVAAVTLAYRTGGWTRAGELVRSFASRRTTVRYLVTALVAPFIILFAGLTLYATATGRALPVSPSLPLYLLPLHLVFGVLIGPLQEELGWRGLALSHLLTTSSRAAASLSVGVMWALWHLPLFLIEDRQLPVLVFMVGVVASSFIYTEFWERSRGSLAVVIVLHAAFNTAVIGFLQRPAENGSPGPFIATSAITVAVAAAIILLWSFGPRSRRGATI